MLRLLEFARGRSESPAGIGVRLGAWTAGLVMAATVACVGFAGVVLTTGRLIELELGLGAEPVPPGEGDYEGFGEGVAAAAPNEAAAKGAEHSELAVPRPVFVQAVAAASDTGKRFYSGDDDTYRTVCVRLCDGFYWTVSFSTTADHLRRDARRCEAGCGVPAKLYKYRNPGGRPEEMVDLDGEPYAKLRTAFAFRKAYDAACRCQANPWDREARAQHRLYELAALKATAGAATAEQEMLKGTLADAASKRMEQGRLAIAAWQTPPARTTRTAAAPRPRKAERPRPTRVAAAKTGTATDADDGEAESGANTAVAAAARPAPRPGLMRLGGSRPTRGAAAPAAPARGRPALVRTADWRRDVFSSTLNH